MILSIIGTGNMAKALALGLQSSYSLEIIARSMQKAKSFIKENNLNAVPFCIENFDINEKNLILCMKPYALEIVGKALRGKATTIYSILASRSILDLKASIKATNHIRTMPNIAATCNYSMTILTGDITFKDESINIFSTIGPTLWVDCEKELDIATALAGCGPAYLALIAEALSDGAVKQGVKREDAYKLTNGLFLGFSKLLQQNHPALLKDRVMSPGGITAAGYSALEDKGVRAACINAVQEAFNKI